MQRSRGSNPRSPDCEIGAIPQRHEDFDSAKHVRVDVVGLTSAAGRRGSQGHRRVRRPWLPRLPPALAGQPSHPVGALREEGGVPARECAGRGGASRGRPAQWGGPGDEPVAGPTRPPAPCRQVPAAEPAAKDNETEGQVERGRSWPEAESAGGTQPPARRSLSSQTTASTREGASVADKSLMSISALASGPGRDGTPSHRYRRMQLNHEKQTHLARRLASWSHVDHACCRMCAGDSAQSTDAEHFFQRSEVLCSQRSHWKSEH